MKSYRAVVAWCTGLVILWLTVCLLIGIETAEGALHTLRRPIGPKDVALALDIVTRDHAAIANVAITAEDGSNLHAWSFIPRVGNGDAVILLHGQGDNRAGMLGNADIFLRQGYEVLLPDSRAHGASGGRIVTYGVIEVADLHRWYMWLSKADTPRCIYGLGDSMGAAILLQTSAMRPGFCAIVAESSFSSFREAAYLRLGQAFHAGRWLGLTLLRPAVDGGLIYARLKYGVDLERASPARAVALSHVPILLIHGLADTNLPASFSETIKAENPTVELWEPVDAGHCGAAVAAPVEYQQRILTWFRSHGPDKSALNTSDNN